MPRGWFLTANVFGGLFWAVGLVVLGYLSYSIPGVRDLALVAMGLTIVATAAYALIYWRRRRRGGAGGRARMVGRSARRATENGM